MAELSDYLKNLNINSELFKNVKFYVSGDLNSEIIELLKKGGADHSKYFSDFVTHLICGENPEENDIMDAKDVYEISALSPKWVLMCAKLNRIVNTTPYVYMKENIFRDKTFCLSKIRDDLHTLWAVITYNGGTVQLNLNASCDYLVTAETHGPKYEKAVSLGSDYIKIVTPDWVVESARNRQLIQEDLFHPRLINWPKPIKHESTTTITGFEEEIMEEPKEAVTEDVTTSTQALLDKLKQRMPWNQPPSSKEEIVPPNVVAPSFNKIPENDPARNQQFLQRAQEQVKQDPQQLVQNALQQAQNQRMLNQQQMQNLNFQQQQIIQQQQNMQSIPQSPQNVPQSPQNVMASVPQSPRAVVHHPPQSAPAQIVQNQNQIPLNQAQLQNQGQQQTMFQQNPNLNRIVGMNRPNLQQLRGQIGSQQLQQQLLQQQQQRLNQQNMVQQRPQLSLQQQQLIQLQMQGQNRQLLQNQQQQLLVNQNQQNQQNQQIIGQQQLVGPNQLLNQNQNQILQNRNQLGINKLSQNIQINQILQNRQAQLNQRLQQNQINQQLNQDQLMQGQQINQQQINQQQINQQQINQQQLNQQQMQQLQINQNRIIGQNQHLLQNQQIKLNQQIVQTSMAQTQQLTQSQIEQNQLQNELSAELDQMTQNLQNEQLNLNQLLPNQQLNINQIQLNQQKTNQNQQIQQAQMGQTQQILQNQNQMIQNRQQIINQNQEQINQQVNLNRIQLNQLNQNQKVEQQQLGLNQLLNQQQQIGLNQQLQQQPQLINQQQIQQQQQNQQIFNNIMQPQQSQNNQQLLQGNLPQRQNIGNPQMIQQNNLVLQQQQQQQQQQQFGQNQQFTQSQPQQEQNFQPTVNQQILLNQQQPFNQQNAPQPVQQQQIVRPTHQVWTQQPTQIRQPIGAPQPRQWAPGQQPQPGPPLQRQFIQLDAQTHNQLQKMPPEQQAAFVQKLQAKQRQLLLKQAQQRGGGHILIRGSVPVGLTPQQQLTWLQQHAQKQGVILQNNIQQQPVAQPNAAPNLPNAPGLSPIHPNATLDQAQQLKLKQIRLQQFPLQREQLQKVQATIPQAPQNAPVRPMAQPPVAEAPPPAGPVQDQQVGQSQLIVNPKTKTALANMLSIRLQSGGTTVAPGQDAIQEPSAAGTLRLMTAQHNASLNTNNRPLDILAMQQRRVISGPNGEIIRPPAPPTPQSEPPQLQFSPRATVPVQHRPGPFYGHNPNLKLPPDLFLLGCIFVVVEIDTLLNDISPNWQEKIEKYGGEVEKQYCARVTHVLCETQRHGVVMQALRDCKRCVTMYWLNDILKRKQVLPPWTALHIPMIYLDTTPASKHLISFSGFSGSERNRVKHMIQYTGAKCTTYFSKHNTLLIAARAEGSKYAHAKKWGVPVVNIQWLTDVMLGNFVALNQLENIVYQQFPNPPNFSFDPKIVPNLMHGWKMPINISQESYERIKRSASPVTPAKPKKVKTEHVTDENGNLDEPMDIGNDNYKILFSLSDNLDDMKKIVRDLGGVFAKDHNDCTHLIMSSLKRSNKLMLCICKSVRIMPERWLLDSQSSGRFVDERNYSLDTVSFDSEYRCDISRTLACPNRGRLFENRFFWVTPSVFPSRSIVAELIRCCGGTVERIRRTAAQIESTNQNAPSSYIIVTDEKDIHLVADLLKNKKEKGKYVCSPELIFSAILRQSVEVEPYTVRVL